MKPLLVAVLSIGLLASQACADQKTTLKTQKEKVSYSIGIDIGNSMKKQSLDIDPNTLSRGIKDALSGNKPLLSDKEMQETMTQFQKEMIAKRAESMKPQAEKNKKEGEAFLEANKKKAGVKTLPDGLQYKVIKEGTGPTPKATDKVTVNYRGTLINGTEFDSSYKRGEPATFPVNGVIPGWTEALQHMKVGSKWELFIPANLAYGEHGAGQVIGPNEVLIFEVELLGIK